MSDTNKSVNIKLDGGSRGEYAFRTPANVTEMIDHCLRNSHIWIQTLKGDAKQVKVNGRIRTWKRGDDNRVAVPYKYGPYKRGLYKYGMLTASDMNIILIPVNQRGVIK